MDSQFDRMGDFYEAFSLGTFRTQMEIPSVFHYLGKVQGKAILDFGCGTGVYSRLLKQAGATRVCGFDISAGMLQHARDIEQANPLGIDYVSTLAGDLERQFDIVLAVYVMPYAVTRQALDEMAQHMARVLKPGGQLLTLPLHPRCATAPDYYSSYGFRLFPRDGDGRRDGNVYTLDLYQDDLIEAVWWSWEALQQSLLQAGFRSIVLFPPIVRQEALMGPGERFWAPYLTTPHAALLDCRLAG